MQNGGRRSRGAVHCRRLTWVTLAALGLMVSATTIASDGSAAARELAGRLIAPCCWTQTLDIHDSPIAEQLRAEIAQRLRAGEPAAKIEDDLAARYSEKIRAVPRGEDPRVALPLIVGALMASAILWLLWLGSRWLRSSRVEPTASLASSAGDQRFDERLDEELKNLPEVR